MNSKGQQCLPCNKGNAIKKCSVILHNGIGTGRSLIHVIISLVTRSITLEYCQPANYVSRANILSAIPASGNIAFSRSNKATIR